MLIVSPLAVCHAKLSTVFSVSGSVGRAAWLPEGADPNQNSRRP